jgi:hypothetical protein
MRMLNIAVTVACACGLTTETRAQSYSCHESDFYSAKMIRDVNASIADTSVRRALGLPNVAPGQVILATDPAFCNRAGLAIDSVSHAQHPDHPKPPQGSGSYYVIKIGTYTGVARINPTASETKYVAFFIFGPLWELIKIGGM